MENPIQNATAAKVAAKPQSIKDYVELMAKKGAIAKALPSVITPERFTRMVLTALSANPKLNNCTPQSFLGAMMQAAQLGLEPNTQLGQSYLVSYKNHGVDTVQFQIGYKGLLDLAYRSGEIEVIQAHIVYENDKFTAEYGLEPKLSHVPADGDRGKPVKCYAMFRTKSGGFGFEVDTIANINEFAQKKSKTYGNGPWQTDNEEMCKKTMLKRVLKYAPLKSEFARALTNDETTKVDLAEDMADAADITIYEVDENGEVVNDGAGA